MPNWCYNSVLVHASTEAELQEFIKFAKQTHRAEYFDVFSDEIKIEENAQGVFWNFITPPEEIREEYFGRQPQYSDSLPVSDPNWWAQAEERRAVSNHWYDWNITNWGTKWDITFDEYSESHITPTKDGYEMLWYFETAWSPAQPVYDKMAEMFPHLEFNYEITEEGNFYAGKLFYQNGELLESIFVDNPTHEDYLSLDIPCGSCSNEDLEECYLMGSE